MSTYIILLYESVWYSLNIENFDDFSIGDAQLFKKSNTLITFQTADLIQYIKSKSTIKILPNIIDLECFDKQMSQEGREFRDFTSWRVINFLKYHKAIDADFRFNGDPKLFLEVLAGLYNTLYKKDQEETQRFVDIEQPVNRILYERQFLGIGIDKDIAQQKCIELEEEIYRIKNVLQLDYGIYSPDSEKMQLEYIESKGFNVIQTSLYSFKIRRNEDVVCNLFYELMRNTQDLDSLVFMLSHWGGANRTFPTFKGFGTITSRATLRQPSLQNLRKSNRVVIVPDPGKKLLYIDYSQFEAGILASMSGDEKLIQLYNTDIYSDLAEKVLGDKSKRSDAKIIFYRYMYGDKTLSKNAKLYFHQFDKLEAFKKSIEEKITQDHKIGTKQGNFRYSSGIEHSWCLSHVIQATASLIYKKALMRVRKELTYVDFLIPMHDATLYQLDTHRFEELTDKIKTIYEDEFKKCCPKLNVTTKTSEIFG